MTSVCLWKDVIWLNFNEIASYMFFIIKKKNIFCESTVHSLAYLIIYYFFDWNNVLNK